MNLKIPEQSNGPGKHTYKLKKCGRMMPVSIASRAGSRRADQGDTGS